MKTIEVHGVYLVDFKSNVGAEFSGKHYAVILTEQRDNTFLVAPLTSKKAGKKYRGGVTIDNKKYLQNPKCERAFVKIHKIREVDRTRIMGKKRYSLLAEDINKLHEKIKHEIIDKYKA